MDAACRLFYAKGYNGTSVRDIAKKASVNGSLISYYFSSKQGLLEGVVIDYYEAYLDQLEIMISETEDMPPIDRLKELVKIIIQYKYKHHEFSCFIQRELSMDSVFVREMMVTYLAKEDHIISKIFDRALSDTSHQIIDRNFLLLQLKGLLGTPFTVSNEWKSKLVTWDEDLFVRKYVKSIHQWIDYVTQKEVNSTNRHPIA